MSTSKRLNEAFKCGNFFEFLDNPKWQCEKEDPVAIYRSISDRQKRLFVQYYVNTYRRPDCYWGMVYLIQNRHPDYRKWAVYVPYPLNASATVENKFEAHKCEKARFAVIDVTIVYIQVESDRPPSPEPNWIVFLQTHKYELHGTAVFVDRNLKYWEYFDSGLPEGDSANAYRNVVTRVLERALSLEKYTDFSVATCPRIQASTGDSFCAMWSMFFLLFRLRCQDVNFAQVLKLFPTPQQLLTLMRYWMCYVRAFLIEHRLWIFSFTPTISSRPSTLVPMQPS